MRDRMRDVLLNLRNGLCEDKCKIMDARSCSCAWAADEIERLRAALQDIATGGHSTLGSAIHRATIALDNEQTGGGNGDR